MIARRAVGGGLGRLTAITNRVAAILWACTMAGQLQSESYLSGPPAPRV